jgi:hypothetical protein
MNQLETILVFVLLIGAAIYLWRRGFLDGLHL